MKKLTITQESFLDYYFSEDYNSESEEIRLSLAEKIIDQLKSNVSATITTREIFNECNKEAIRINFLEEFEEIAEHEDDDRQLCELKIEYEIILKD